MDNYKKKYDKALERAKSFKTPELCDVAEYIFPELKEPEDERISKEIIKYLEQTVPHNHRDEVLKSKEWIAWLEKQGEQNLDWSEEDENRINRLIAYFEDKEGFTAEDDIAYANWLKSIKQKIRG